MITEKLVKHLALQSSFSSVQVRALGRKSREACWFTQTREALVSSTSSANEEDLRWLEMGQYHLVLPRAPSQPVPLLSLVQRCPQPLCATRHWSGGLREGLPLHMSDPSMRCMRNFVALYHCGGVLVLELFVRAVFLGTCRFT